MRRVCGKDEPVLLVNATVCWHYQPTEYVTLLKLVSTGKGKLEVWKFDWSEKVMENQEVREKSAEMKIFVISVG